MISKYVDDKVKEIKRELGVKDIQSVRIFIHRFFSDCRINSNSETIVEYRTSKQVNY